MGGEQMAVWTHGWTDAFQVGEKKAFEYKNINKTVLCSTEKWL